MEIDQDTVVRLLWANRAMVLGYIMSILGDGHLAEDVFQDVALIVLKKRADLHDADGFPAWIRKIARFEALNAARRKSHAPKLLDQAVIDALEPMWAAGDSEPASKAAEALRVCIKRLTPRAQQLIQLRYLDGISGQSLADRLAKPLNTIYVALTRIHRALSSCIKAATSGGRSP